MYNIEELNAQLISELRKIAETLKIKNGSRLTKQELVYKILDQQAIIPEAELPPKIALAPREAEAPAPDATTRSKRDNKTKPSRSEQLPKNNGKSAAQAQRSEGSKKRHDSNDVDVAIESEGVLEIMPDGYGFLRSSVLRLK
ncbi:MAG: Rho termination factor N-terminal domain-containing protein, partial [Bacteroidota bacterium]